MAEYIDREALLERLKFKRKYDRLTGKRCAGLESAIAQVEKAPTADVVEVRHGEWVDKRRYFPYCSECGTWADWSNGTAEFNYCPNCGADMRGEKNGKE